MSDWLFILILFLFCGVTLILLVPGDKTREGAAALLEVENFITRYDDKNHLQPERSTQDTYKLEETRKQ